MLLELSVIPLGRGRSISADVADLMKIIDASHLDHRLTPTGTILEGSWDRCLYWRWGEDHQTRLSGGEGPE